MAFASAVTHAADTKASRCDALPKADFSGVADAPTKVTGAQLVAVSNEMPGYCRVEGYTAPQLGFELWLPTDTWNGKFFEAGIGGFGGTLASHNAAWCNDAVRRGYACIMFDTGHKGTDLLWAYNNLPAEVDYAIRSPHAAFLAGTAITKHYYDKAPDKSYFMGCSGGGRQGLLLAQGFPWDFDGIIALDPGIKIPGVQGANISYLWNARVTKDKVGRAFFSPADVELLHNAAIEQCDTVGDGIKDGVIGDPLACRFDPADLQCRKGQSKGCLSKVQVTAAEKVYEGPTTSKGLQLACGAVPGSERTAFVTAYNRQWLEQYLVPRYQTMSFIPDPGSTWTAGDYDFDTDFKREGVMEALISTDNPNLHWFKENGGKLIMTGNWAFSVPTHRWAIDYYEAVEALMGGRDAAQEFVRLFLMPGHDHCWGGVGANSVDYLGHLEDWVEQGRHLI